MNRLQMISGILSIVIIGSIIVYFQYRFYRTPIASTQDQAVLVSGGSLKDGIPSIDEPKFESVSVADQYLDDKGYGLFVSLNGKQRFYPYQILVWHEVVNDVFGKTPILISYCALCFSGSAYDRTVNGVVVQFGVSGKLMDNHPVLYNKQTDELLTPPFETQLKPVLSLVMTWANFKNNFPNGQVLSRETEFVRDYTADPYKNYDTNNAVLFPVSHQDDRLSVKTVVFGYINDQTQKAYPLDLIKSAGTVNDVVGNEEVVIFWDEKLETVRGFSKQDGKEEPIILRSFYWFSWATFHPKTELLEINE
ncbi:DUF3179 domain-containing protein [Candidatus Uhrbacteria bacterium]|nr:DUF3179 domain-containing protein [Candidatus Uhrbacteria bacterium]